MADIAVVMLTVNQRDATARCLASFRSVDSPAHSLVVWDNGSVDSTVDFLRAEYPDVIVHHHPTNLGAAAGRNAAAKLAIEEFAPSYILFIDNDMVVTPAFLRELRAPFADDARLAQTAAKIRFAEDRSRIYEAGGCRVRFWLGDTTPVGHGEVDRGQYDQRTSCVASTGAMMVRADVFREVGGFDTAFDPYGCEDLDFSMRVIEAGYYAMYIPEAVVFHERSQTFEGGGFTKVYARKKARNWFLFMRKHASPLEFMAFLFVGGPFRLSRAFIREGIRGNLGAVVGLLGGGLGSWAWPFRRSRSR